MTYKLYVGSNNETKELEIDKLEQTLNLFFTGYTVEYATGYWQGERENTAVVTVEAPKNKLTQAIASLKDALHQDAIAYQQVNAIKFL